MENINHGHNQSSQATKVYLRRKFKRMSPRFLNDEDEQLGKLKNIKKTRGINDYLFSIKKIGDTLIVVGSSIDNTEHI
ncbi:hypothetical protein CR513_56362, partial [Mucuna pruriens]